MKTENLPESLLEAVQYFADEDRAHDFFVSMRWPDGVRCAHCGSENVGKMVKSGNRRLWNCKGCKKQFTAKIGTVFNESPLPLSKWLPALWLVVNAKNGISSCELARALKITQKSAWFMGHRIRASIQRGGGIVRSDGVFECDESFIGGLSRNMHKDKRELKIKGTGAMGKSIVMGLLARHSEKHPVSQAVTRVVPSTRAEHLMAHVRENIPAGAEIHTDTWVGYKRMHEEYAHKVVDHAECYVKDGVHTNGLENFWSLLKRTLKGTYVHCAPFHLYRYLDEQTYRFNERKHENGDQGRFVDAVKTTTGRRLTWGWADWQRAQEDGLTALLGGLGPASDSQPHPSFKPLGRSFSAVHFRLWLLGAPAFVFGRGFSVIGFLHSTNPMNHKIIYAASVSFNRSSSTGNATTSETSESLSRSSSRNAAELESYTVTKR